MGTSTTVEGLWTDHHVVVRAFLMGRCSSAEVADDLTAETFLHALIARESGREVSLGWLMTVARRRLMDHWRSSFRRGELIQRLGEERPCVVPFLSGLGGDPVLQEALMKLCRTQRVALVLRYCDGRSVQQIADHLSLTYTATESLLARGRRRLAREYSAS